MFDAYGYLVGIASNGYRPDLDTENVNGAVNQSTSETFRNLPPCQPRYARNFGVASNRQSSAAKVFPWSPSAELNKLAVLYRPFCSSLVLLN